MAKKFTAQYKILGIEVPDTTDPREKAEIIFQAACTKEGIDPALLPDVSMLPEKFRAFPVSAYKLEVISTAIRNGIIANWDDLTQDKWGSWWWLDKPGFRLLGCYYVLTYSGTTGGSRLCTFSESDQEFFASECIGLWADFMGATLPQ